ncbi:MAG: hypothetical protein VX290_04225 [Candidatus Latescibacterota bacterium]|nr:hypothetical protein [Candidatus Latescibacterota bacterium]
MPPRYPAPTIETKAGDWRKVEILLEGTSVSRLWIVDLDMRIGAAVLKTAGVVTDREQRKRGLALRVLKRSIQLMQEEQRRRLLALRHPGLLPPRRIRHLLRRPRLLRRHALRRSRALAPAHASGRGVHPSDGLSRRDQIRAQCRRHGRSLHLPRFLRALMPELERLWPADAPSRLVIRCGDETATLLRRRQKLSVSTTAHGRGLQVADTGLIMQLGHAGGAAAMRGSARDRQLS